MPLLCAARFDAQAVVRERTRGRREERNRTGDSEGEGEGGVGEGPGVREQGTWKREPTRGRSRMVGSARAGAAEEGGNKEEEGKPTGEGSGEKGEWRNAVVPPR